MEEEIEIIKPPAVPDFMRLEAFFLRREIINISGLSDELWSPTPESAKEEELLQAFMLGEFIYLFLIKKIGMRHIFARRKET